VLQEETETELTVVTVVLVVVGAVVAELQMSSSMTLETEGPVDEIGTTDTGSGATVPVFIGTTELAAAGKSEVVK
jgi:hypothetical protein